MPPKRSIYWTYFDVCDSNSKKAICQICKIEILYSGNSSNLRTHLFRHHRIKYDALISENSGNNNESSPQLSKQTSIKSFTPFERYPLNSSIHKNIVKKLVYMIAKDMQPLSVVEDEGFINFQKELNPRFAMPCRKSIRSSIENLYEEEKQNLILKLDSINKVHLTTDMWTDTHKFLSYMAVTCHFIDNNFKLQCYNLQTKYFSEKHTALNIREALIICTNEWNIKEKVVSITTDNGANVVAAVKDAAIWYHYPCFAHTLNLIVQDAFKNGKDEVDEISDVLSKCRQIVHLFKSSAYAANELKKEQENQKLKPLSIKKEVPTRWNSTLVMLESIIKLKDVLTVVLSKINVEQQKTVPILVFNEYEIIYILVNVLKPFDISTKEMSSEIFTSGSKVIPITKCLMTELNSVDTKDNKSINIFKKKIIKFTYNRMGGYENNVHYGVQTYLDPRFKHLFSGPEMLLKIKNYLINEIKHLDLTTETHDSENIDTENIVDSSSKKEYSFWGSFDDKVQKISQTIDTISKDSHIQLRLYEEMPILKRTCDPLEWWRTNKDKFPNLAILAQKFLSKPATSVPSERVFSKSGQLLNNKRTQLNTDLVDKMVFLNMNLGK